MRSLIDSKYKLTILVLSGLIVFCGLPIVYCGMMGNVSVDFDFFHLARVKDLKPCLGLDPATGGPLSVQEPLRVTSNQLDVCALLEAEHLAKGGYPVVLDFLWRYEGETVHRNWDHPMYKPGYILDSWKLEPGKSFRPGLYRVDVVHGRDLLASTEFTVTLESSP